MLSFTPHPLYPWGKDPRTHWIGGWTGPKAGLDRMMMRKIFPDPARNQTPASQPVSYPTGARGSFSRGKAARV